MKIEKSKHDHKLTHLLKVGIFAMLMIAPLFASCSQLMYVTFNKNAYQSTQITGTEYYTTYEYETNEVNSFNDLVEGNIYHLVIENKSIDEFTQSSYCYFSKVYVNETMILNSTSYNSTYSGDLYLRIRNTNKDFIFTYVSFIMNNEQKYSGFFASGDALELVNLDFYFVYRTNGNYNNEIFSNYVQASDFLGNETVNERPVQALDNAFYYGVEKMTESPLFNWTQNTALYTGIKAMTDNLQVQTNVIAVLVTYWTILTIIYIIIDIVLALFTKMTHLLVRSD